MFDLSKSYRILRANFLQCIVWSEKVTSNVKLRNGFESQSNQKIWNLGRKGFNILIIEWVVWVRGPCRFRYSCRGGDQNSKLKNTLQFLYRCRDFLVISCPGVTSIPKRWQKDLVNFSKVLDMDPTYYSGVLEIQEGDGNAAAEHWTSSFSLQRYS